MTETTTRKPIVGAPPATPSVSHMAPQMAPHTSPCSPHPSHVLVVTLGTAGDVFPFIAVGRALHQRGHRVTLLAAQHFEAAVLQAGLDFHALFSKDETDAMLSNPLLWHHIKGFSAAWLAQSAALQRLPDLVSALPAEAPCVLLVHPGAAPAAALARARRPGLRIVTAYLAPSNLRTCHDPLTMGYTPVPRWMPMWLRAALWRLAEATTVDPVVMPTLNRARGALGLAPLSRFWDHMMDTADASVALFPAWYGPTQPDWPQPFAHAGFQLYDPQAEAPLPATLQAFLAAGDAPIVFTPGTGYQHGTAYFAAALSAVKALGRRAIFLTPHRDQVPAQLPDSVLWQSFLPLRALLPHAAALVYHGGIGTLAEALRAGVPQLLVPCAHDQFDNAQRIHALGAGQILHMRRLRAGTLRAALAGLLASSETRARCGELAARLAGEPSAAVVCELVEEQVRQSA
jgi:rhamnosyltransferase subunit B